MIGDSPYEGIGCRDIRSFTLSVILNERKENETLQRFICECSAAAKQKSFSNFGLSDNKCFAIAQTQVGALKIAENCVTIFPSKSHPIMDVDKNHLTKDFPTMSKELCVHQSHQCDAPIGSLYLYQAEGLLSFLLRF